MNSGIIHLVRFDDFEDRLVLENIFELYPDVKEENLINPDSFAIALPLKNIIDHCPKIKMLHYWNYKRRNAELFFKKLFPQTTSKAL